MLDRNLQKNTLVEKLQYNLSKNKTKIDSTFSTAQSIENAPYYNNAITPFYQKKEENSSEIVYTKNGDQIKINDSGTVFKADIPIMSISIDGFNKEDLDSEYLAIVDDNTYLQKIEDGKILFKFNDFEEYITYPSQYNIQTVRLRMFDDNGTQVPTAGLIYYNPLDNNHYFTSALVYEGTLRTLTEVVKWHWNDTDGTKNLKSDWVTTSQISFELSDEESHDFESKIRNSQPLLQIAAIPNTSTAPGHHGSTGWVWCICLNSGVQSNRLFASELIGYGNNKWYNNESGLYVRGYFLNDQSTDITVNASLTFKAVLAVEAPNYHCDLFGDNETYEYITAGSYVKAYFKVEDFSASEVGILQPSIDWKIDYSYPPTNNTHYNGNNLLVKYGHWRYNNGNYETVAGSNKNIAFGSKAYDYNEIDGIKDIPQSNIAAQSVGGTPDRTWHSSSTTPLEYGVMIAEQYIAESVDYSQKYLNLNDNNKEKFNPLLRSRTKPKITKITILTNGGTVVLTGDQLGEAATNNAFVFHDIGANSATTFSNTVGQCLDDGVIPIFFTSNGRAYTNGNTNKPFATDTYQQKWAIQQLSANSADWQAKSRMDEYCANLEQGLTQATYEYEPYWIYSNYLGKTAPFKSQFNDLISETPSAVRAVNSSDTYFPTTVQTLTTNIKVSKEDTIDMSKQAYHDMAEKRVRLYYIDDNGTMIISSEPNWNKRELWKEYVIKDPEDPEVIDHYEYCPTMYIIGATATEFKDSGNGVAIHTSLDNNSYIDLVPWISSVNRWADPTGEDVAIYRYWKDITRELYQGFSGVTINFTSPNTAYAHPEDPSAGGDWTDTDPWHFIYYDSSIKKMLVNTGVTKADGYTTYQSQTYKTPSYYHNTNKIAQYGNWRLIYNTGVGLSNISYSEDAGKVGTLLADWFSIKKVEVGLNKIFYQDVEGKWHKIEIKSEGIKKQKIILDKYIIFNTTSFYNCYDFENNKVLHACSDWNNRLTYGGTASNGNWGAVSQAMQTANKTVLIGSGVGEQYTFAEEKDFPSAIFNPVVENYFCNDFQNFVAPGSNGQEINAYVNISDYSSLAYYLNTIKNDYTYVRDYLRDITFPTTQSGSVYLNFNLFSEYKQSYCNFDYVKNDNNYYFTLYANNKNFPLYNLTGGLKNLKGFFVLQGLYYAVYEDYITSLERAGFVITNETVVTSIRGMKYVGFTEESAYFFSPTDKSLFSFIPNNSLKKVAIFTEINDIENTYYDVAKKWIIWKTDKGLYVYEALNDYIFKLSDTNNVETVYSTYDDLIVKDTDYTNRLYRFIKTDGYSLLPYKIKTSYYGAGQNKVGKVSSLNMTFDDEDSEPRYINIASSTISDIITEAPAKPYGKESIINHNVKDYNGRGISFTLDGTLPINEIAVDFNSVGNTQKIINNRQEIR